MKKYFVIGILSFCLALSFISCGSSDANRSLDADSAQVTDNSVPATSDNIDPSGPIEVENKVYADQITFTAGNTSVINLAYPEIVAGSYGDNVQMLNDLIVSHVTDLKSQYQNFNFNAQSGSTTANAAFAMEYTQYKADGGIVSILIKKGTNDGVAPSTTYTAVNFDLHNSNQVILASLEGLNDDSVNLAKNLLIAEMNKNLDVYANTISSGVMDTIDLNNSFLIKDKSVIFFFDPVLIGANASDLLTFEFTLEQLYV